MATYLPPLLVYHPNPPIILPEDQNGTWRRIFYFAPSRTTEITRTKSHIIAIKRCALTLGAWWAHASYHLQGASYHLVDQAHSATATTP